MGTDSKSPNPRVAFLNPNPGPLVERIRARFPDLSLDACDNYDAMADLVSGKRPEVVLAFKVGSKGTFPREVILGTDSVKWIQASGAGIDHWMPWDPEKVTLTNASGIHGDVMAQYIIWAILNHQLGFPILAAQQADKVWNKRLLHSVAEKTLVVVGFGSIGEHVGRLGKALGMRVIGVRSRAASSANADRVVGIDRLHEALGEADYVLVVLPSTEKTRGIIDDEAFAAMKKGAYLVNTGRGKIVDEAALSRALASRHLAGAALDVFATEPLPPESPFWDMENVIVTPHASGDSWDWHTRVADLFCDNLERWMAGKPLENIVDPARGY